MTKDWDPLRDEIQQLYHVENRKLTEVMRIIHGRHDFKASERSYRAQMRKWGYMKYSTQDFPKPNRRSQSSKRHLGPSSRGMRAITVSDLSFAAHNLDQRPVLSGLAQPSNTGPPYLHDGHPFNPGELTSQPLIPAEQLHAVWPLNAVSQHGGYSGDRRTDLHFAVIRQDEQTVRRLLFDGFSVENEDNTGNQPLHYAVKGTSENIVNLLIRFGADVNAKGQLGQTPLHLAASKSNFTRYLLTAGANTEVQDENGDTPVHLAVLSLNQESKGFHLSALYVMVDKRCDLNIGNLGGMTPFHGLITQDPNQEVISAAQIHCLQNGASSTLLHPDGRTPLEIVLWHHQQYLLTQQNRYYGNLWPFGKIISVLIDKKANPQTKLPSGVSLISECFKAMRQGQYAFYNNGGGGLCKALCGRADLMQDRNSEEDGGGSLLHMLAQCCVVAPRRWGFDIIPLFTTLLNRGADPNLQNEEGKTPLHLLFQTKNNHPTAVLKATELMIKHGVKPLIPDLSGDNPVFAAVEFFASTRSKSCAPPVRLFLKSTLDFATVRLSAVEPEGSQRESGWGDWDLAAGATEWKRAFEIIRDSQVSCSKALVKAVKEGALGALAERHMNWDGSLDSPEKLQQRRKHIAQIIRDCESIDIPVDKQYYQELVRLCL